jgi:hypothetical protein
MSMVGALGGLISWGAAPLILSISGLSRVQQENYWIAEIIDLVMIGLFIGALCIGFTDYWAERKVSFWRLVEGAAGGCLAGVLGGVLFFAIRVKWVGEKNPLLVALLGWIITGASIGLVLGLVKYGFLFRRVSLSLLGGAMGAAAGGSIALSFGEFLPYLTHALGLMITGCGVAFGSTAALVIMRNAQIKFMRSDDPDVENYFITRKREWDLHRGDRYLFGRNKHGIEWGQYIHIPDKGIAQLHAEIYEANGLFYLSAHNENLGPSGSVFTLRLMRLNIPRDVDSKKQLENDDEIIMGSSRFRFSFRGRNNVRRLKMATAALVWILFIMFQQNAVAQSPDQLSGAGFELIDKVRLYQCWPDSERPCFRIKLNMVDLYRNILRVPVLGQKQAIQQIKVFEGNTQLEVAHVSLGFEGGKPRRFSILLVDVSGSMLDSAVRGISIQEARLKGKTKFQAMKEACWRFAGDYDDGVDQMVVIPFDSRQVVAGVEEATFCASKESLGKQINGLCWPRTDANTGLYSAVQAAIVRLSKAREEAIKDGCLDPRCLLVVMTDGMNDVDYPGDDPNLLKDFGSVKDLAERIEIPIVTVGFGDADRIDLESLENLAWPPAAGHYLRASNPEELIRAFQKARSIQLQQLQITFLPRQTVRGQLIRKHEFSVRFDVDSKNKMKGVYSWMPSGLVAPPFEGLLPLEERPSEMTGSVLGKWLVTYWGTLVLLSALLYILWFKVPPLIWADEHDLLVLRHRALSLTSLSKVDVD